MKIYKKAKERTEEDISRLQGSVTEIIAKVRKKGDKALFEYNAAFDKCMRYDLRISRDEIEEAYKETDPRLVSDIKKAASNIRAFAERQRQSVTEVGGFSIQPGAVLGHRIIPVDSVCCYVPGGGYPLYSTALMLAIPAKVAGVERVCACSPVVKGTDRIHPHTLVAMDIAGVDEIYTVGGAQAVAAFSYGTEQIAPVSLIVGPGNRFVTEAKRQCYGRVGIDFVAGPSEVLIISDGTGDPEIAAADILAQSEHDPSAKGILVTTSEAFAEAVNAAVGEQLESLSTSDIAAESWKDYGEIIIVESIEEAVEYSNEYAPEHLELIVSEEYEVDTFANLRNYGSLFIGQYTAEVFGDYASGTNHTLPTLGASRYTGGVWVGTFLKTCTFQKFTKDAMHSLALTVSGLARGEGLEGHARAADIRVRKLK